MQEFNELVKYKNAFELLAEANLIILDDEPKYWIVLDEIDKIFKKRYVISN